MFKRQRVEAFLPLITHDQPAVIAAVNIELAAHGAVLPVPVASHKNAHTFIADHVVQPDPVTAERADPVVHAVDPAVPEIPVVTFRTILSGGEPDITGKIHGPDPDGCILTETEPDRTDHIFFVRLCGNDFFFVVRMDHLADKLHGIQIFAIHQHIHAGVDERRGGKTVVGSCLFDRRDQHRAHDQIPGFTFHHQHAVFVPDTAALLRHKAMDRTGKREVPETGLFLCGTDSGNFASDGGDAIRFTGDVGRRKCAFSCGHIDPVGEGGKIIVRGFHAVQTGDEGGDRSHICRVAVRIPTGGVHDLHGFVEVVSGIRPRHDHHGMIRHHMTTAAIFVIAVFFIDPVKGPVPVPILLRPGTDIPVDLHDEAVFRDHADALIQHLFHIQCIIEGGGDHGSDDLCGIDRFAIVGDPGSFGSQFCGKFHVAGGNHAESVNKDLGTDLLGNGLPVHGNTAGGGGMDAVFQAQVSRMFRGETHAAPPENGLFFQQIVQPCIAEKPVGGLSKESAVLQRADECEGAGNIVVRHDERHAHFIGTVMIQDRTELFLDPGFGSALDGSAEVHTGNFAQQSSINFFFVPFPICKHGKLLSILIQPDKRTAADWLRSVFLFRGMGSSRLSGGDGFWVRRRNRHQNHRQSRHQNHPDRRIRHRHRTHRRRIHLHRRNIHLHHR